jgi:Domain of unknown function (DUF1990)
MSKTEDVLQQAEEEALEFVSAAQGTGPLLERDYSAVIEGASCTPEQVAMMIREHFEEFAPPETAVFQRAGDKRTPLEVGDEMEIRVALRGQCKVRVVHFDDRSLTLRTLKGHPEAGRITFGAGRDEQGRLTFRILSRTRASGLLNYLGYLLLGKQLQARCWIRFIDRVAGACGGRIPGRIRVRTRKVGEERADCEILDEPCFNCVEERH